MSQILQEVNNLIEEAFNSVVGSFGKMVNDINDLEQGKSQIMKLPMMNPADKIALLQNHINNTEMLKQGLDQKKQEIANYSSELVNKHYQSMNKAQSKEKSKNA